MTRIDLAVQLGRQQAALDLIHDYADLLAKHPSDVPAADVAWKLRQILGDPTAPDAQVSYGARVKLRKETR